MSDSKLPSGGVFGRILGPSGDHFGSVWGAIWATIGSFGRHRVHWEPVLGYLEAVLSHLEAISGQPGAISGRLGAVLEPFLAVLGPSRSIVAHILPSGGCLGSDLDRKLIKNRSKKIKKPIVSWP